MADEEQKPDEHPRPRYGELAPEGWVWRPPADADRLDTSRRPEHESAEHPAHQYGEDRPGTGPSTPSTSPAAQHAHPHPQPPGSVAARREPPRWNLTWTLVLLIVGFLGMSYSVGLINAFPAAIQLVHTNEGLGDYHPAASISGILTAGSITMIALWVASAATSVWLLAHRRLSFYVPLIAGVIAFVVLIVFLSVAIATDPALVDFYSGFTPTATPTP